MICYCFDAKDDAVDAVRERTSAHNLDLRAPDARKIEIVINNSINSWKYHLIHGTSKDIIIQVMSVDHLILSVFMNH